MKKRSIDSNDPVNQFNRSFESIHWIMVDEMKTLHSDLAKGKWLCASRRVIICLKARDGLPLGPFLKEVTKCPDWGGLMPRFRLTNVPIKPIYNYLFIVDLWCLLWCPQYFSYEQRGSFHHLIVNGLYNRSLDAWRLCQNSPLTFHCLYFPSVEG